MNLPRLVSVSMIDPGLMFFSTLMRGMGGQAVNPAAVVDGNQLLLIEDGVVYRVNLATMALEGQVAFRPKKDRAAALAKLVPLMAGSAQRVYRAPRRYGRRPKRARSSRRV